MNSIAAVTAPSRCDGAQDGAANAFGTPGAIVKLTTEDHSEGLCDLLPPAQLRTPEQVHGTTIRRRERSRTQPAAPIASHSSAKVPLFFATFIDALHESRRCRAAREIRRYHHIVEEARAYEERFARRHEYARVSARELSARERTGRNGRRPPYSILWKWLRMGLVDRFS